MPIRQALIEPRLVTIPGTMTNTVPHMHQALGLAAQALFLSSPIRA